MGKLFCLHVFGRRMKATKLKLDKETVEQTKDTGDPCGVVGKKALEVFPLVADSQASGSNDASLELRPCISSEVQSTTSPDPQLRLHVVRMVKSELERPVNTDENLNDRSSWPLSSPKKCFNETVSVILTEATSRSGDGRQDLHTIKSCPDLQGECADACEDSSEGAESASNPPTCEDLVRQSVESIFSDTHAPQYFGLGNSDNVITTAYEVEVVTPSAGFLYSPDTAVFPSSKSDRTQPDDESMTGHISDPGVYDRDERQSMFEFSALLSNGVIPPFDANELNFLRKSESDSHLCKLLPSERNIEIVPSELGENGSSPTELTFCSADKVILKRESSSKVLDSCKRNSWWKVFMFSHRNLHLVGSKLASDVVGFGGETIEKPPKPVTGYTSDICDMGHSSEHDDVTKNALVTTEKVHFGRSAFTGNCSEDGQEDGGSGLGMGVQASYGTALWPSKEWIAFPTAEPGISRVEEWVRNIQQPDVPTEEEIPSDIKELSNEICIEEVSSDVSSATHKIFGAASMDAELANAAIASLNPFSTVAHISGIGLREVPRMGLFNSLKALNLSANNIVRVSPGCLPRSLHTLDLSRNRMGVIEGFRELTRLRILNLSYNRISRIGHGLANCTLIKELYLVGNKIAEVEGFHRLLKLTILDLSFNKLTTSKALGQLAANYNSLLALNLLGNPVHINVGEEQMRKLVLSITPHVTYLNKQPIKGVSAREAVVDSVARAALGTSHRNSKSSGTRASRRVAEARSTHQHNKSHSRRSKDVERRHGFLASESDSFRPARLPSQLHHHGLSNNDVRQTEKGAAKEHRNLSKAPIHAHDHLHRKLEMDTGFHSMHRSRSESALQEQVQ